MSGANLSKLIIGAVNFNNTDFTGADLSNSYFYSYTDNNNQTNYATFSGSNLSDVNFTGADLKRIDFQIQT